MEDYKPNSNRYKEQQSSELREKRVEKVISGQARQKKKSEMQKLANIFTSEDTKSVKYYIFTDVIVPGVKDLIVDAGKRALEMIFYGESSSRKKDRSSRVSYRSYYDNDRRTMASGRATAFDYDDVIFDTRGDAEAVLDAMYAILEQYRFVSIGDLYDLADIPTHNYTANKYGWTDLRGSSVVRTRDGGYTIKFTRAYPLD